MSTYYTKIRVNNTQIPSPEEALGTGLTRLEERLKREFDLLGRIPVLANMQDHWPYAALLKDPRLMAEFILKKEQAITHCKQQPAPGRAFLRYSRENCTNVEDPVQIAIKECMEFMVNRLEYFD